MTCMFCNRNAAVGNVIAGIVGNKSVCRGCALELADVVYHAANGKFTKKSICDKLDKTLIGKNGVRSRNR